MRFCRISSSELRKFIANLNIKCFEVKISLGAFRIYQVIKLKMKYKLYVKLVLEEVKDTQVELKMGNVEEVPQFFQNLEIGNFVNHMKVQNKKHQMPNFHSKK